MGPEPRLGSKKANFARLSASAQIFAETTRPPWGSERYQGFRACDVRNMWKADTLLLRKNHVPVFAVLLRRDDGETGSLSQHVRGVP